jgi:hypothetical protein
MVPVVLVLVLASLGVVTAHQVEYLLQNIIKLYAFNKMTRSVGNVTTTPSIPPTFIQLAGNSSGTYTSPTGCTFMIVEMTGGGGAGYRNNGANISYSGGNASSFMRLKVPAGSYSYSVGTLGVGGASAPSGSASATTFGAATCARGANGGTGGPGSYIADTTAYTVLLYVPGGKGGGYTNQYYSNMGGRGFWGKSQDLAQDDPTFQTQKNSQGSGGGGKGTELNNTEGGYGGYGRICITEYY